MMAADDYTSILQWHPEMVLTSETPVTWQGFLIVSCKSDYERCARVKLKLSVPNYPSLKDAEIYFGGKLNILHSAQFRTEVDCLLKRALSVSSFLRQLQTLIANTIDEMHKTHVTMGHVALDLLQELKEALRTPSEVELSSSDNLDAIRLSLKGVSITLRKNNCSQNPWTVISSDLPEVPYLGPFERNVFSLRVARNKFQLQVEIFGNSWSRLREIDQNCWVIDPIEPKPYHLYRRIYLTPFLSALITINPFNVTELPDIKFMGSDVEVERQRNTVSNNIHNWDPHSDILTNLQVLFNIHEFPQKVHQKAVTDTTVIVLDGECCICFSMELDDMHFPDKICNNEKCKRCFHSPCLLEWLQSVPGNQIVFDYVHGVCPNCGESISCCIK